MHLDTEVLELSVDEETGIFVSVVECLDLKHLPLNLYVDSDEAYVDINGLNKWWLKRGIPERRDGLTPLMGYLRIQNRGRLQLMNNGLSLSDCYWIKRKGDPSKWDEVNFFVNTFSDDIGDIMFGGRNKPADKINIMSPDLSTNGWLKKTWKIDKGIRYLLKSGSFPNYQEPINEILATKLLESLNLIPYVPYSLGRIEKHTVSVCRNFIENGFEFVPASTIYKTTPRKKDETIYDHLMERCRHFGINNASDYVDRMLQVDFIMANTDRHLGNFGFIRNAQTLALSHRVTCLQSDIYLEIEGKFHSIVSNPPIRAGKKVTYEIYSGAKDHLCERGSLYIVIRKAQGAKSVKDFLEQLFGNVTVLDRSKGYYVLKATKVSQKEI